MSGAHYQINQAANSVPTGTQDVARLDVYKSQVIHLVGVSSGGQTSPSWTILAWPDGSARAQPANPLTFDATYTPDVEGAYVGEFLVDDGAGANARRFVFAVTRTSTGLIVDDGVREPAFSEQVGDDNAGGNDRGYAKAFEVGMAAQVPAVANIAALRNRVAKKHKQVNMLGYSTTGDGGEGLFTWSASSTTADNGGAINPPTRLSPGGGGRPFNRGGAGRGG